MQAKYMWPCLVVCALATFDRASAQSAVHWQPDLESAKRVAAQSNRLVLLHFWTESCAPCMKMEREVFSRSEVAAAIEASFVPVRVNVQTFPLTAREYGIKAWPADVIVTPQGKAIASRTGGLSAAQYVDTMNQMAAHLRGTSSPAYAQASPAPPHGSSAMAGQGQVAGEMNRPWPPSGQAQQPISPPASGQAAARPEPWGFPSGQGAAAQAGAAPGAPFNQPSTASSGQPGIPQSSGRNPVNQPVSPQAMASYNPSSQAGMPQDPAPYPPAGAQQPYTGTYRPQTAAPAVQQRQAQPWQAETARWNPNAAAPRADVDPKVPPLALDGYCPVTLSAKEQWAKGDPRYGVIHRGRTYLFAGPEEAKRFFADPDHYAPVLSGMDVVIAVEENRQVPGRREYGAWYEGRVFLFAGDASYRKFDQDPTRYAAAAAQGNTITARRPADRRNGPPYSPDPAYPQYPPPARY